MLKKAIFKIKDMTCTSCAMLIDGELEDSGKVKSCKTNYAKSQTEVEFDPVKIKEEEILQIIKKAGYNADLSTNN